MAMALSLANHFSTKGKDASSSDVEMDEEEPNWILPEKRSREKYSPLRSSMVFRSRSVHDLRVDLAASADDEPCDVSNDWGEGDVNASVEWAMSATNNSSSSDGGGGMASW